MFQFRGASRVDSERGIVAEVLSGFGNPGCPSFTFGCFEWTLRSVRDSRAEEISHPAGNLLCTEVLTRETTVGTEASVPDRGGVSSPFCVLPQVPSSESGQLEMVVPGIRRRHLPSPPAGNPESLIQQVSSAG